MSNRKKFGNKKAEVEASNAQAIDCKGSIFGLFHRTFTKHYKKYEHVLLRKSAFVSFEVDPAIHSSQKRQVSLLQPTVSQDLYAIKGSLFDYIFDIKKHHFAYAHLDFCKTAWGLTDEGIHTFIRRLSKWECLKRTFYLEITLARRGDLHDLGADSLLDYIQIAFLQAKWRPKIISDKRYTDTQHMRNALIQFKKV